MCMALSAGPGRAACIGPGDRQAICHPRFYARFLIDGKKQFQSVVLLSIDSPAGISPLEGHFATPFYCIALIPSNLLGILLYLSKLLGLLAKDSLCVLLQKVVSLLPP